MSRGPLPQPGARRRNAPTIQSTSLPADGRKGRTPKCPYALRAAGTRWWRWAWRLPQAAKWDDGALYAVARRAQLEDDLAALEDVDLDELSDVLLDLVHADEDIKRVQTAVRNLEFGVRRLKGLAGGRLGVMKEMRELDGKLGLSPKALADLRWMIAQSEEDAAPTTGPAQVRRLRAVDPSAATAG
jgi:hypothetical protein